MFTSRSTSFDDLDCPRSGNGNSDRPMAGTEFPPHYCQRQTYEQCLNLPSTATAPISANSPPPDWLYQLLATAQLQQFYVRIRDQLQVSRLEHFDYVTCQDLEKVGLARPAARRLLDLIKKRKRRAIVGKFIPSPFQNRLSSGTFKPSSASPSTSDCRKDMAYPSLTCLIQDKDVCLQGNVKNIVCYC